LSPDPERLAVLYAGRMAGKLWMLADERLAFEYADSWLADPGAFSISMSLPLSREIYTDAKAGRFFANLLPEGRLRQLIAQRLGISEENDFILLKAIGGECAGALSIVPEEEFDRIPAGEEYQPLSRKALSEMVAARDALAFVAGEGKARLSLAGAQDKLPVYFEDGEYFLPVANSPSSHILKFPDPLFSHLQANEVLTTRLAAEVGLRVVEVELDDVEGEHVCRVTRYDRRRDDKGKIHRIHQEDFCQALGLSHRTKYEQEGGPSFETCFNLVGDTSVDPLLDTEQLLKWLIFNAAVGNADGHAKNLSLLFGERGSIRLAPFYDLVCTRAYQRLGRELAMRIGETADPGQIRERDWNMLAESIGVGRNFLLDLVREVAEGTFEATERVATEFRSRYGDSPAIQMVVPLVEKQARRLVTMLDRT
jgi:serine/threonine-protein kinase HipA